MLRTMEKAVVAFKRIAPQYTRVFNLNKHDVAQKGTMAEDSDTKIVWMDMEMTGLDVFKDQILEIACLVTDKELNIESSDFHVIIHQSDEVLNSMNEWCIEHHKAVSTKRIGWVRGMNVRSGRIIGEHYHHNIYVGLPDTTAFSPLVLVHTTSGGSGLTDAVRNSTITLENAEQQLLEFLKKYIPQKSCPLAGNSIYMDRLFLRRLMPTTDEYLHYRIIDVSTIHELAKRWNYPAVSLAPKKQHLHRAIDDIRDSIEQLKYYKSKFLKTIE